VRVFGQWKYRLNRCRIPTATDCPRCRRAHLAVLGIEQWEKFVERRWFRETSERAYCMESIGAIQRGDEFGDRGIAFGEQLFEIGGMGEIGGEEIEGEREREDENDVAQVFNLRKMAG